MPVGVDVAREPLRRAPQRDPALDLRLWAPGEPLPARRRVRRHRLGGRGARARRRSRALAVGGPPRRAAARRRAAGEHAAPRARSALALALSRRRFAAHFEPRGDHVRFFSPATLRELLDDLDFDVLEAAPGAAAHDDPLPGCGPSRYVLRRAKSRIIAARIGRGPASTVRRGRRPDRSRAPTSAGFGAGPRATRAVRRRLGLRRTRAPATSDRRHRRPWPLVVEPHRRDLRDEVAPLRLAPGCIALITPAASPKDASTCATIGSARSSAPRNCRQISASTGFASAAPMIKARAMPGWRAPNSRTA